MGLEPMKTTFYPILSLMVSGAMIGCGLAFFCEGIKLDYQKMLYVQELQNQYQPSEDYVIIEEPYPPLSEIDDRPMEEEVASSKPIVVREGDIVMVTFPGE